MILLILTSTPTIQIGLFDEGRLVARDEWSADQRLSAVLSERILSLLAASGKAMSDVTLVRVHAGPGGFTTLRIGVVTANVLGYALGVPTEGVAGPLSSLAELRERPATRATTIPVIPIYDHPPRITPRRGGF